MKRIIIWPDIYKEQGHWLPCINLANSLIAKGHQVSFMGIPDCEPIVAPYIPTGKSSEYFTSVLESIYPAGYSLENKLEPQGQRWKPHHLLPICRGALDKVFDVEDKPVDLLISGYFTGLETLLIHHMYKVPFVTITTYLRHPQDTPGMHAKTKLIYMQPAIAKKLIESVMDEGEEISIDNFIAPMTDPKRTTKEIIPCPRAFDFDDDDWIHSDPNVSYVEPMINRTIFGTSTQAQDPTQDPKPITLGKVIYGCAGSQVQDYETKAHEFFKNLILMMQTDGMSGYTLVLAVGARLLAELNIEFGVDIGKSTLPDNVILKDWVSQVELLGEAEVAFIHGGLATIKESISEQVPIVIVPHGKDQMDNALRLQRKGLGLIAQIDETSPQQLRALVTAATSSNRIKNNLKSMKEIFDDAESKKPSLEIIDKVLNPEL